VSYSLEAKNLAWDFGAAQNWNSIVQSGAGSPSAIQYDLNVFEQWLDLESHDRFMVDRQGKVLWCRMKDHGTKLGNETTSQQLKIRVGGTLPADLLLAILNAGSLAKDGSGRVALVENGHHCGTFVARVTALGEPKAGPLGVTIVSYRGLSKEVCADLKRLWDLSSGEIRILAMTFQGLTVQEVAEKADISIETVRTHIRHIYAKMGVNSREALFAVLGPIIG
jgi:DNA-binding CsgD family transcriptional regulator